MGKVTLLPELLKDSRASNTVKSYIRGFNRWALSNSLGGKGSLPGKAFHVALYLVSLIQTSYSTSPVINAFYSISGFIVCLISCLRRIVVWCLIYWNLQNEN